MRFALAQTNPTIGSLQANAASIATMIDKARDLEADCVLFPELAVCGYPPKDLLLQGGFLDACEEAADRIAAEHSRDITIILGVPRSVRDSSGRRVGIVNSLVAYRDATRLAAYDKRLLPTYDVFDEDRYFTPGSRAVTIDVPGRAGMVRLGLAICEDLWRGEDAGFAARYADGPDPIDELAGLGCRAILSASASPFVLGKGERHVAILQKHAQKHNLHVVSVNQVGGNDDLIFDGRSCVVGPDGRVITRAPAFETALVCVDLPLTQSKTGVVSTITAPDRTAAAISAARLAGAGHRHDEAISDDEQLFHALVLGVRDYLGKTGFKSALLGLSGGIDSAVTAAIAAAALGSGNVLGVSLPGPYSSEHSKADAYDLAQRLGMRCITIPIGPSFDGAVAAIDPAMKALNTATLGEKLPDLAEENLQSRLRGTILMALSNRTGAIVLTTGNKSELAVGYCTLYGDMNGGLAVLSDVTKHWVYRLARFMNEQHTRLGFAKPPIPAGSIEKAPSAELRPNQTDQDSLPAYDVLDEILSRYVERHENASQIIAACAGRAGFDDATVRRVIRLTDLSEYKRRQAATGLKVTGVAFGTGRRMPIAQGWKSP
ncbi:MAG: NAD+ synthase [Phycisphaerales bacterium]|nr:NAD+ synthase [Phycisphaerales bacterium]